MAVGTASIQKNVGRGALINLTEAEMDRLTLPDDFEIQTIAEFCRETKSGSTPSRTNNEYWENGTISWVKSGEVHNNITLQTEEYITSLGVLETEQRARATREARKIRPCPACGKPLEIMSIADNQHSPGGFEVIAHCRNCLSDYEWFCDKDGGVSDMKQYFFG